MKKIIILFLASLLIGTQTFAQATTEGATKAPSFIGITGGWANAVGNFTKSDYADNKSGFANSSGLNLGIEGAYFIHKNIGIGGSISNTTFYTKGKQALADGYKEAFDVDSTTVTDKGKYSTINFLIGPYFSFPVKKFTFDIRVLGGLANAKTPEITIYLEDQKDVTIVQKSASANAFSFQGGFGIRYSIVKNLCLKINADYFFSNPDFKITNENRVNSAGRLINEYKQAINGILINFGIAYQFD
jgi:outer membrane protein W